MTRMGSINQLVLDKDNEETKAFVLRLKKLLGPSLGQMPLRLFAIRD